MEALQPKISESSRIYNPRRKAQKPVENTKGKKPVGRNVGKLLQIMNMPVDVFFEVHRVLQLAVTFRFLTPEFVCLDRPAFAPSRPLTPLTRLQ